MKRILCDVDGVLVDFVQGLCSALAGHGLFYRPQDFLHWDLRETLSHEAQRAVLQVLTSPGFCQGLEWYEGARDFLDELQREGEVYLVTAPYDGSETWERERKAAMAPFPRSKVLPVPGEHKRVVRGDVFIEDHPKTAHDWLEEHEEGIALLIDRPWNGPHSKEWHCHRRMYRVKDYVEALTTIRECA